ncbi:hypothetical protein ACFUJY_24470 [Streptomyces sp. NPDC057249]|uniref:hypothetical protein n=1 Tax=Streptomyces sp. NPDC057249 TaxID=3346067 RepID=UPI00362CE7BE
MSHPVVTDDRPRHAWIASLISTVVTLPLAFLALAYSMMAPMACDSCSDEDSDRFDASFGTAWTVSCCGLVLSLAVLLASWVCTRTRPAAAILLAVVAPVTVFLAWAFFMGLVDWP